MTRTTLRPGEKQDQGQDERPISKKATGKGKATRAQPKRSRSQAPPSKRKDKQPMVEQSDPEEESESENEPSPKPKEAVTKKKATKKKPTYNQLMKRLKNIPFAPTRYPDHGFLQEVGLIEDVQAIFTNLGLGQFFTMAFPTYEDPTREFLASFKVTYYDASMVKETQDLGYFEFRVGGRLHKMTFAELGAIYGFQPGTELEYYTNTKVLAKNIGVGKYNSAQAKNTHISHPGIRYVHKVLAHTLYARRESGTIKTNEMTCLIAGLKPFWGGVLNKRPIASSAENVCVASVFVSQMLHYQDWVWTSTDKTPVLSMGGLVTPILAAKGVELTTISHEIVRLDPVYLTRTQYLAGRTERNFYAYRGNFSEALLDKRVLLPQLDITTLLGTLNYAFNLFPAKLYNLAKDGPLIPIKAPRSGRTEEDPTEHSSQPQPPSPVYGSARYDFKPYDNVISDKALREAHQHIHLLQRFVKWQGRTIKKLVKGMKGLNGRLKNVEAKLSSAGCSNPQPDEVVDSVAEQATNMEEDVEERHSFHGVSSLALVSCDPPRASSYERRQRRKRRAERSPTPCSSNSSYSLYSSSMN